jgi:hypothetical protein
LGQSQSNQCERQSLRHARPVCLDETLTTHTSISTTTCTRSRPGLPLRRLSGSGDSSEASEGQQQTEGDDRLRRSHSSSGGQTRSTCRSEPHSALNPMQSSSGRPLSGRTTITRGDADG